MPLTITSRATHTSLSGSSVTTLPASVATNISQIVRGNVNIVSTANTNNNATTVLPLAKVLPSSNDPPPIVSVASGQSVYIHSRPPSNLPSSSNISIANSQGNSIISVPTTCTYYMPVSTSSGTIGSTGTGIPVNSTAVLQSITTNTSSITTNVSSNSTTLTASYAPQAGSFAVVPASNRNTPTSAGIVSSSVVQQSGAQPIPVRFNPQLIVDGSNHIISMSSNQSGLQGQQKTTHTIPASNVKSVVASSSPRTNTVVATASRKRDQSVESYSSATSVSAPTKSAVKNLNSALMSVSIKHVTFRL